MATNHSTVAINAAAEPTIKREYVAELLSEVVQSLYAIRSLCIAATESPELDATHVISMLAERAGFVAESAMHVLTDGGKAKAIGDALDWVLPPTAQAAREAYEASAAGVQ